MKLCTSRQTRQLSRHAISRRGAGSYDVVLPETLVHYTGIVMPIYGLTVQVQATSAACRTYDSYNKILISRTEMNMILTSGKT